MLDNYMPITECGCWFWLGGLKNGYGTMYTPQGNRYAHREAYKKHKGPIPKGKLVRHSCDIKCCINPDHLLVGTAKDNAEDARQRGQLAIGERAGAAKLTATEVLAIRADQRTQQVIANEYGLHQVTVSEIKTRKIWRHV